MYRLLLSVLLLGSASAAELRIYPSFTEVRDPVRVTSTEYTVALPEGAWVHLLPDSLHLDGVSVQSRVRQMHPTRLSEFEGRQVGLINDEGRYERVTLVRAEDLLIRDAQGRFRHVEYRQLAFDQPPPRHALAPSQRVTFNVAAPGNATLSYLTRAVHWSPRYNLTLSGSTANLQAFADIHNTSDQAYDVTGAELLAGQVELIEPPMPAPYGKGGGMADAAVESLARTPVIETRGENRGLYRYDLTRSFRLEGQSSLSLPFLQPKATFERYAGLTTGFIPSSTEGKLNRHYRVKSNVLLPAGPVTVRDEGRVVGQAAINLTSAGDPLELELGSDPDVTYDREVRLVKQDAASVSYRLVLTVENDKNRVVRAELREMLGANAVVEGQAERIAEGLLVRADVPAGGKVTRTYTVTLKQPR